MAVHSANPMLEVGAARANGTDLQRVVLVEDVELDRLLATRSFAALGSTVRLDAVDFEGSRSVLLDTPLPSLVIVHYSSRGGEGRSLFEWIRSHPVLSQVPVLAALEGGLDEEVADAYRHGANGVVRKPLGVDQGPELWRRLVGYWIDENLRPA